MSNTDQAATAPHGFGKMLNSLQGLQQRLEDFSIADVANAEANARTLILRLKQLQETIAAIALLKNAAVNVSQAVTDIQQAETGVNGSDSLENHPQLHAIVKASKLIKLQKLMAALKASTDYCPSQKQQVGEDLAAAVVVSVDLTSNLPRDSSDPIGPLSREHELASLPKFVDEATLESPTFETDLPNAVTTVSSPVLEAATDSPTAPATTSETGPLNIKAATDFPTAEAEFETAIASEERTHSSAEGLLEDFPTPAEQPTAGGITAELTRGELASNLPKSVKPRQNAQITPVKKSKARNKESRHVDESKALVPANESFDLRLLDDLVSNYGEFASNPNLPATVKKKELQAVEPAANEPHNVQPEQSGDVEAAAPVVKKNGDLDRQLKKIIKDYGEYDLYSDKQTTNIKKAGILAFVFLGLVFGGIYFFKAPPSTAKTSPAAANTSSTTPDDRKLRPAVGETNADSRDTSLGTGQNEEKPTAKNR